MSDHSFDADEFMREHDWAKWSDCREMVEGAYAEGVASAAAEITRLRSVMEALRGLLRAIPTDSDMAEGMTTDQIKEVCDAYDTARAAIDAARTEGIKP